MSEQQEYCVLLPERLGDGERWRVRRCESGGSKASEIPSGPALEHNGGRLEGDALMVC